MYTKNKFQKDVPFFGGLAMLLFSVFSMAMFVFVLYIIHNNNPKA